MFFFIGSDSAAEDTSCKGGSCSAIDSFSAAGK